MENTIQYTLHTEIAVSEHIFTQFPALIDCVQSALEHDELSLLVAEREGETIAVGVLKHQRRHNGRMLDEATLIQLEVIECSRMQGIAKGLLNAIEAYAATLASSLYVDGGAVFGKKPMQSLLTQSGYLSPAEQPNEKTSQWKKSLV